MNTAILFVSIPVILAIITNGLLAINKDTVLSKEQKVQNPYLPPGWIVGTVWVILFGLLGYTAYLMKEYPYIVAFICIVIIYCLAYPVLTDLNATSDNARSLNRGAFILATILVIITYYQNQPSAIAFTIPLWLWTAYVNSIEIFA
jgi:tryptophan-rich sensory protein